MSNSGPNDTGGILAGAITEESAPQARERLEGRHLPEQTWRHHVQATSIAEPVHSEWTNDESYPQHREPRHISACVAEVLREITGDA